MNFRQLAPAFLVDRQIFEADVARARAGNEDFRAVIDVVSGAIGGGDVPKMVAAWHSVESPVLGLPLHRQSSATHWALSQALRTTARAGR